MAPTADRQQPYNLRIAGTATQTLADGGLVYDVRYRQFFQADLIRGIGGRANPDPGRRPLAQPMHDPAVDNPAAPGGPPGSVVLGADGSMAAFVPASRAMTWQLTNPQGEPVVRERYWLTFQPGEVRVCASCHGVNTADQAGAPPLLNPPAALRGLLQHWKGLVTGLCEVSPDFLAALSAWPNQDVLVLVPLSGCLGGGKPWCALANNAALSRCFVLPLTWGRAMEMARGDSRRDEEEKGIEIQNFGKHVASILNRESA